LYLLTFIICFDRPKWYGRGAFTLAVVPALVGVGWALFRGNELPLLLQISAYLTAMFLCCLVCHGELYRLKPHPRHLTAFYLTIAGGGAMGGVGVAIVAPLMFNSYLELHWGLGLFGLLLTLVYGLDNSVLKLGRVKIEVWRLALVGLVALLF